MSSIDSRLRENAKYAGEFSDGHLSAPPASGLAVVTCMDARIDPIALLGLKLGDAHVIRNAGGVLTHDVIRSLMISQRLLGTREIMVIQHTACGMMTIDEPELRETIKAEIGADPPFELGAFTDLDASVRSSIAQLRESPFIEHTEAIRGFVYEVETGRLRELS